LIREKEDLTFEFGVLAQFSLALNVLHSNWPVYQSLGSLKIKQARIQISM